MAVSLGRRIILPALVLGTFPLTLVSAQEGNPGPPNMPAGIVSAFQAVGQNVVGTAMFSVQFNPGPPNAPAPNLDVWLASSPVAPVHINIVEMNPPDPDRPRTWLRISVWNGTVAMAQDPQIGAANVVPDYTADLSTFAPPARTARVNPPDPDLRAGLVRALENIGQTLLGPKAFFAVVRLNPPEPDLPPARLELWLAGSASVPVHVNLLESNPPDPERPRTWLRVSLSSGGVAIAQDPAIGTASIVPDHNADLSANAPPGDPADIIVRL